MLIADVERYIALRRTLGYKLVKIERHLRRFALYANECDQQHLRATEMLEWAAAGRAPATREERLRALVGFARFMQAEDPRHEVPPSGIFRIPAVRPVPYIYSPDEIARIIDAAGRLRRQRPNPLRRELYVAMFGLIAAAGLRVSEALALQIGDLRPDGALHIRGTKFGKSRLVPLHGSVIAALERYLVDRRRVFGNCDLLFPSTKGGKLCSSTVNYTFRQLLRAAGIAPGRATQPRIHDLRHTFATRVLEQCGAGRGEVARHFVALATYLGHADIRHTYWYLQATPEMMTDIAAAAEMLVGSEAA